MVFIKKIAKWLIFSLLPITLQGKEYEIRQDERCLDSVIRAFEKEVEKEFSLSCEKVGASMPKDIQEVIIGFSSSKKTSIEEARKLGVTLMQRFLKRINEDEKIIPYLREHPFTVNRVSLTLYFYDYKNYRPHGDGTPEYVSLIRNNIHYQSTDEKGKFVLMFKEPFEEAVKIIENSKENK